MTGEAAAIYGDDLNETRHRRTRRDVAGASDDGMKLHFLYYKSF